MRNNVNTLCSHTSNVSVAKTAMSNPIDDRRITAKYTYALPFQSSLLEFETKLYKSNNEVANKNISTDPGNTENKMHKSPSTGVLVV